MEFKLIKLKEGYIIVFTYKRNRTKVKINI